MYVSRSCSCNAFAESACSSVLGQSRFYTSPSLRLCSFHYCSMTSVFCQLPSQQGQSDQFTQADVNSLHGWRCHQDIKFQRIYMDLSDSDFVYSAETFLSSPILQHVEMIWNGPLSPSLGSTKTPASPCLLATSAHLRPFPCSSVALC